MMINNFNNNLSMPWQNVTQQQEMMFNQYYPPHLNQNNLATPTTYNGFLPNNINNYCQMNQNSNYMKQENLFSNPHSTNPSRVPIKLNYDISSGRIKSRKRNSLELDDDHACGRPTKQILSEKRLFKKFESIHIDKDTSMITDSSSDSDDSLEENVLLDNNDLNNYVYKLYNDKSVSDNSLLYDNCNPTLQRLAREEREKLSKAIVLYNPKINYITLTKIKEFNCDGEANYTKCYDNDKLTITDVTNEEELLPEDQQSTAQSYYEMED